MPDPLREFARDPGEAVVLGEARIRYQRLARTDNGYVALFFYVGDLPPRLAATLMPAATVLALTNDDSQIRTEPFVVTDPSEHQIVLASDGVFAAWDLTLP